MPTSKSNSRVIGITLGDPCGIGPEVVMQALSKPSVRKLGRFILIGEYGIYKKYTRAQFKNCSFVDCKSIQLSQCRIGQPSYASAKASLAALDTSIELLKAKEITSLVTAPVCKEAIGNIKPSFRGHTEYLAHAFGVKHVGMMFVADKIRTIIVTRHIPLLKVSSSIHPANIYN